MEPEASAGKILLRIYPAERNCARKGRAVIYFSYEIGIVLIYCFKEVRQ